MRTDICGLGVLATLWLTTFAVSAEKITLQLNLKKGVVDVMLCLPILLVILSGKGAHQAVYNLINEDIFRAAAADNLAIKSFQIVRGNLYANVISFLKCPQV